MSKMKRCPNCGTPFPREKKSEKKAESSRRNGLKGGNPLLSRKPVEGIIETMVNVAQRKCQHGGCKRYDTFAVSIHKSKGWMCREHSLGFDLWREE